MDDQKYIIYGAGRQGQAYLEFLRRKGLDACIIGFCDRQYKEISHISDRCVFSYDEAKKQNAGFIVAVGDEEAGRQIREILAADSMKYYSIDGFAKLAGMSRTAFNREFCAVFHMDSMEEYFEHAEADNAINVFWDETSEFNKMFRKLDLENVIELACGRGRHVAQYTGSAGHITLVDILAKNIEFCKERFRGLGNITYYQNNGYNLEELKDSTYTGLFSYDAVVHFEMMDIYEYLTDIYRIMVPGGRALLHHSNNNQNYKASFNNTRHGRSFMSKDIFAYLAYRAGFDVVEQKVIDWEGYKDLDCITLLQKPIER